MAITLISNVGFTEIDTSGTVNTIAGVKDNLPVQFYKIVSNINGQLVIDNNDNHKKLILDMNGKTINGENQTAITYNGNDPLEIKGQGLITSGGTINVTQDSSETSVSTAASFRDNTNQTITNLSWVSGVGSNADTRSYTCAVVPSGTTLAMSDGTTYGPGTRLSSHTSNSFGGQITQAHVTEIFGTNGSKLILTGTATNGSFSNAVPSPSIYSYTVATTTYTGTWDSEGFIRGRATDNAPDPPSVGNDTPTITSSSLSGATIRIVQTRFTNDGSQTINSFTVNSVNQGDLAPSANVDVDGSGLTDWSGSIPSTQSLSGSGTGTGTVTSVSGGDGSTGNVVVSVADNVLNFPAVDGDEVYAGMEYTPDQTGASNSSQVYPKSYGNTVPVGVSSSAFPNGGMGSSIFSLNTDLFSPNYDTANYTYTNSRQGRCATRLINDLGNPVRFTYSGTIDGNNFALTGNGASASGTVSGGSATGITTSVVANSSYEFFFTNTSHVLKFYRSGRSDSNQVNKWFWSNRPTSTNGANNLNRQSSLASSYGTTYTMTSVTLPNAGTYTDGKAFTVNNGNDTDISFTGVSTTAIVTASTITTVTNLSNTSEDWSYTGTRSSTNIDGDPLGAETAFGGTGVTNNASGVPTAGINLTNYSGTYSRTQ